MFKYITRRMFWSLVTLFTILILLFLLLQFLPGTPFNDEKLSEASKALLNAKYGLDQPFFSRFGIYMKNILTEFDFGISLSIQRNWMVKNIVLPRLGISVRIGLQALALGTFMGIVLGVLSASKKNTWVDTLSTLIAIIGVSIPSYVFALLLSYVFGFKIPIFSIIFNFNDPFKSSILPTIALSMFVMAQVTRFLRTELIEVLGSDYIRLVEAKGVNKFKVVFRHGLRNALISVITILGPLTVTLLTGSLVVEKVYAVPGIGSLLVNGILTNDYNVIVMIAFVYSALYITMNLLVDILYGIIDPRIRVAKGA
ncbi:MAG TPA: ABC transporter permease [Erysipelotrichaceae bacterium]|nr:ABC transporter permease [Erysipelotrichaceae bacterium]